MNLEQLIKKLQAAKEKVGNVEVYVFSSLSASDDDFIFCPVISVDVLNDRVDFNFEY